MTSGYWDISSALEYSGQLSWIVWEWEILQIFFVKNNVVPVWIEGNYSSNLGSTVRSQEKEFKKNIILLCR